MRSKGQGVGAGKLQKRIIEQLHGSQVRYTPGALSKILGASPNSVSNALNGLLDIGVVKSDVWGTGYCYRAPDVANNTSVAVIKMRPQIEMVSPSFL